MKKLLILLMIATVLGTVGCGKKPDSPPPAPEAPQAQEPQEPQAVASLPDDFPMVLHFSSGAGGWQTELTLNPDGTFTGQYHDSDMGSMGDGYPNGTVYICDFEGRFGNFQQAEEAALSLTLDELTVLTNESEPWIEDGIRFVPAEAYGLTGGTEFRLYLPEYNAATLSENARMGWPLMESGSETLGCYALHNVTEDQTFYDWDFWLSDPPAPPPVQPEDAEPPQPPKVSPPSSENVPADRGDILSVYETGGIHISLPAKYLPQLLVSTGQEQETFSPHFHPLLTVHERASVEAAQADFGDSSGFGFLFGIELLDQLGFEELVQYDYPGCTVFARDETHYYAITRPTDVQLYRLNGDYTSGTEDWETLNALGDTVCQNIIDQNGLTPYSHRDLYAQPFTYEGQHIYVNFYPYFTADGSHDNFRTLVLSQPAVQGQGGIWCVERMLDEFGSTYLVFPQAEVPAAEYYADRQAAHDAGLETELLTALGAAEAYLREGNWFSGELAAGSLEEMTVVDSDYMDTNRKLHEVIPALLTGSGVSDEELLACIGDFRPDTWGVLGRTYYGSNWWPPLLSALENAALGENQENRCGSMMRFYLTCYGQYEAAVREILNHQKDKDPQAFVAALEAFMPEQQAQLMGVTLPEDAAQR